MSQTKIGVGMINATSIGDAKLLQGDGAWVTPAGAWVMLTSSVASASASITFTDITSTYDTYCIALSDIKNATDDVDLYMRTGDSSGIDTAAADYQWGDITGKFNSQAAQGTPITMEDQTDSEINITGDYGGGMDLAATSTMGGMIYLHAPADAVGLAIFTWMVTVSNIADDTDASKVVIGSANRQAVITTDRIQLYMSSGNITSGRATLYGISHS